MCECVHSHLNEQPLRGIILNYSISYTHIQVSAKIVIAVSVGLKKFQIATYYSILACQLQLLCWVRLLQKAAKIFACLCGGFPQKAGWRLLIMQNTCEILH